MNAASGGRYEWIGGTLKADGTATSIVIPAQYVPCGVAAQYTIRGFNTKNTLGSISIYAAPASAAVR